MPFEQIPQLVSTVIMTQSNYLFLMQRNTKLAGNIKNTIAKPTAAGIQSVIKEMKDLKEQSSKTLPKGNNLDNITKSYDKMIFSMSNPMTVMVTPASAYAKEIDSINSTLSSMANVKKEKAEEVIKKAEQKTSVSKSEEDVTDIGRKVIAASKKVAAELPAPQKPKSEVSLIRAGTIVAGSLAALFLAYGIYLKVKRR